MPEIARLDEQGKLLAVEEPMKFQVSSAEAILAKL